MGMRIFCCTLLVCAMMATAARAGEPIDALYDDVARDLAAGKPLVVDVEVALCDHSIIDCGGRGLGDGDDLARNLYWATDGGLRGWFERRGSPWRRVERRGRDGDILETVVYERHVVPAGAWLRRGVRAPFVVRVVANGWRGRAIDGALDRFVQRLSDDDDSGAHVVAYVGHNGWMDRDALVWPPARGRRVRGFIAVACLTRHYLQRALTAPTRVPLLLTRDLLFAGSHALDGALDAFARGGTLADIRLAASRAYATGENKPLARVQTLFTN
ncbi:MAG TPA: hypothetical protein VGL86_30465 [Polyangia bacterium]|jgi:hypothetical protein